MGITMASLGLGFVAEPAVAVLVEPLIGRIFDVSDQMKHSISFAVALAIVMPIHVVAGEMVAKNIAIAKPELTARRLAGPMQLYVVAFQPVIWTLTLVSNGIVRLLGVKPVDEINVALTVKEFHTLLTGAREEGVIEPSEHELLSGALEFGDRSVGSLMMAADEMVSMRRSATVAAIEQVVAESGHSRIPVWGSAPDDVSGFVHAKDLLHIPAEDRSEPVPMELIRRMLVVGPDVPALELMRRMCGSRIHIALVRGSAALRGTPAGHPPGVGTAVAEAMMTGGAAIGTAAARGKTEAGSGIGGTRVSERAPGDGDRAEDGRPRPTLGVITLEDVLEALVGEIYDETDDSSPGTGDGPRR